MSTAAGEVFLENLLSDLVSRYPRWQIEGHCKIEWSGQPRSIWPEADIVIRMPWRHFIIEYDEDSDPGRSLVKYWPILHEVNQVYLTIIEVWKSGPTVGHGFAKLAGWMGIRLMRLYPGNMYAFIERTDEPAELITDQIVQIISGRDPFQGS